MAENKKIFDYLDCYDCLLYDEIKKGGSNMLTNQIHGIALRLSIDNQNGIDPATVLNLHFEKEKEINDELKKINEQIEECKIIESTNKNISNQLKIVEKMLDTPNAIKDFNKDIFENLVENIIVGEVDENGNTNSKVIKFILKIGTDYRYEINEDKSVSFRPNNMAIKFF